MVIRAMLDLTLEENMAKEIERIVEGYSFDEKLVVRITGRYLEIRAYRSRTAPVVRLSWTRIHRNAIATELELEIRKKRKGVKIDVMRNQVDLL